MYENIYKAFLMIALDNGGINRFRSSLTQKKEAEEFLKTATEPLNKIEEWLSKLSREDLVLLCADSEEFKLTKEIPEFIDDFLNKYFEEVC
jgi:hypothetical protein